MHSRKHFLNISDVIYGYEMLIFFLGQPELAKVVIMI